MSPGRTQSSKRRRQAIELMKSNTGRRASRLQAWMIANDILPSEILRFMPPKTTRQWFGKLRWETQAGQDKTLSMMKSILRAARLALAAKAAGHQVKEIQMGDLFDLEPTDDRDQH